MGVFMHGKSCVETAQMYYHNEIQGVSEINAFYVMCHAHILGYIYVHSLDRKQQMPAFWSL